jgi:CspA family cold shock protein
MHTGKITALDRARRFGFIKDQDGTEVFFHESALKGVRFTLLKEEQMVEFEFEDTPKGPRAFSISVSKG